MPVTTLSPNGVWQARVAVDMGLSTLPFRQDANWWHFRFPGKAVDIASKPAHVCQL